MNLGHKVKQALGYGVGLSIHIVLRGLHLALGLAGGGLPLNEGVVVLEDVVLVR